MEVWEGGRENFEDLIRKDSEIQKILDENDMEEIFDLKKNVKHVDAVFARLGLGAETKK